MQTDDVTIEDAAPNAPERRCIVTGDRLPVERLLRFVVGPEGKVVPDVANKLPGRGIWVTATRKAVESAVQKGLFSKAAKESVIADAGLADLVATLLKRNAVGLFGVARKGGALVTGFEKVRGALAEGNGHLLLEASDAGRHGDEKMRRIAGELPIVGDFTAAELAEAMGKEHVVHALVVNGLVAANCLERIRRWRDYEIETGSVE